MTDQPILESIDERHIDFYGDDVTAVLVPTATEPQVYVPLRPLCTYLGLAWSGQFERIKRDPVLSDAVQSVRVTRTNPQGGDPDVLCLPLKFLPGWLFGIQAARMRKVDLREKVIRYQRECFQVLWDAFQHEILPITSAAVPVPTERSGAEIAYEMATAIQHLARQQMEMEQRLGSRMDSMARWATQVERRISSLYEFFI